MIRLLKRINSIKSNFNFGKVLVAIAVTFTMLMQGFILPVSAAPTTKTMTVTIGEGGVDQSNLSETINIPNLKSVVSVTTDTGSVSHSISGENITINASGGSPSRTENNPTKYSKYATSYSTSSSDSFSNTKPYSDASGYSGTLSKNSSSYVIDGSYIPSDTKTVTDSRTAKVSDLPTTISYNSGGYIGTLISIGLDTYISGTLADAKPMDYAKEYDTNLRYAKYINFEYREGQFRKQWDMDYKTDRPAWPTSYYYGPDSEGYTGSLPVIRESSTKSRPHKDLPSNPSVGDVFLYGVEYRSFLFEGIVTKPDTRQYKRNYSGEVTKPAVDTRVWQQSYSGTVYKAGVDNYYQYTVTVEYIYNQEPILTITLPNANSYFSKHLVA